jgi:lactam utilization protein B
VHSDTAGAVELATALRRELSVAGIACRPFASADGG